MQQLKCGFQQYEWGQLGSQSAVAHLALNGGHADSCRNTERYAELWIGTHPSKPSHVIHDQTELSAYLQKLGGAGAQIPYLLKVLSIDKALSIQSHPHKELAEKLHREDPQHYPDQNHKPELVVALTPFEALCCFRPNEDIARFLKQIPPLCSMVANSAELIAHGRANTAVQRDALRAALKSLYAQPSDVLQRNQDEHLAALAAQQGSISPEDGMFRRLTKDFPGDVGVWMVYFLNYLQLSPGDGLFLAPNEPHAYLSGNAVEIQASSDNVMRAGLTPKFKDVDRLLESLTYNTSSLKEAAFTSQWGTSKMQVYSPPPWCTDFTLTAVRLSDDDVVGITTHSTAVALVIEGSGTMCGNSVSCGQAFVIPNNTKVDIARTGNTPLLLFIAQKNYSKATTSNL
jgi:mannose-6-phosphate isomerase